MTDAVVVFKGKFPVFTALLAAVFLGLSGYIAYIQFSGKWQALAVIAAILALISAIPTIAYFMSHELLAVLPFQKVVVKGSGPKKVFFNYSHKSVIRVHADIISYRHRNYTEHFVNLVDERGTPHLLFESTSKQLSLEIAQALCQQSGLKLVHNKSSSTR